MADPQANPPKLDLRDHLPPDFGAAPLAGTARPSGFARASSALAGILWPFAPAAVALTSLHRKHEAEQEFITF